MLSVSNFDGYLSEKKNCSDIQTWFSSSILLYHAWYRHYKIISNTHEQAILLKLLNGRRAWLGSRLYRKPLCVKFVVYIYVLFGFL